MMIEIAALLALALFVAAAAYYGYLRLRYRRWLKAIFFAGEEHLFVAQQSRLKSFLAKKLALSGLEEKELYGIAALGVAAAAALIALLFLVELSLPYRIMIVLVALGAAVLTPPLYLQEQIAARIKRIDADLAIFLDLLIIILEGGGGLNNAIDEVTREAEGVLRSDLLEESRRFKQELTTYSSEIAYANLVTRTGSEEIATLVGFLKLSEETGIGVKTVFENQSEQIKEQEMLSIEKRATTMNIQMTMVVFIFILPAVIAMVGLPMAADALMPGF